MVSHWFRGVIDAPTLRAAFDCVTHAATSLGIGPATVFDDPPHTDPRWLALQVAVLPSPEIAALREHGGLRRLLANLTPGPVTGGLGDVIRAMPPGAPPTPPHQDAAYLKGQEIWTAWIPLHDCPMALGPLGIVPGSEAGPVLPHSHDGLEGFPLDARPMRAGDVLIFHARTIHGGLPNTSDRVRYSVDLRYAACTQRDCGGSSPR